MTMKSVAIALTLSTAPLIADLCNWEFGARMGYRYDKLKHTFFDQTDTSSAILKENFDPVNTAQISGFTKFRLWWLELGIDADYGWTVGGNIQSTFCFSPFDLAKAPVQSCASGETWDAFFTGGLRLPFYDHCDQGLFITPLGGYCFQSIKEKRRNLKDKPIPLGKDASTFVSISSANPIDRKTEGLFAGVSVSILRGCFYTSFGYAYHWIDLNQNLKMTKRLEVFTPFGIDTLQFHFKNSFESSRNRGNRGWLSLNYQDPCGWRAGLYGSYFAVSTSKKNTHSSRNTVLNIGQNSIQETQKTTNLAKTKWRTFTISVEAAYEF